ncbi:single-stranded DNA-binding protein [Nocardioides sp. NPDC127503]|uniref:single-stranded DNA-binding protein n=1 Tax=Nocardioides sp. NPDC127503 TaxID=3154516 RepID=UPI003326D9B2
MTIPTQLSLHGFIGTVPHLTFGDTGVARFYVRVGVDHYRKEAGGNLTKLDPTFHSMAMFGRKAEKAYNQFQVGDQFIASGYVNEYQVERNGAVEQREEFIARQIGHDAHRTRYTVTRGPSPSPPTLAAQAPARAMQST